MASSTMRTRRRILLVFLSCCGCVWGCMRSETDSVHRMQNANYNDDLHAAQFVLDETGYDINLTDAHGETPLHFAVKHGKREVVELLLQNAADPNREHSHNGDTPLHYAVMRGEKEIVRMLVDAGADPLKPNVDKKSALESAKEHRYQDIDVVIEILASQ